MFPTTKTRKEKKSTKIIYSFYNCLLILPIDVNHPIFIRGLGRSVFFLHHSKAVFVLQDISEGFWVYLQVCGLLQFLLSKEGLQFALLSCLRVRTPPLEFQDQVPAWLQYLLEDLEQVYYSLVPVIQMNPFCRAETEDCVIRIGIQVHESDVKGNELNELFSAPTDVHSSLDGDGAAP